MPSSNRSTVPFVTLGAVCVIGGGLASAAAAPSASYHSSWAVAYLVLIAGVAQAALGVGQARLAAHRLSRRVVVGQLLGWNVGNAAVITGTLLDVAPVLYVGAVLLIFVLAAVLVTIHGTQGRLAGTVRGIVALILVSIPVGTVIQAVHH